MAMDITKLKVILVPFVEIVVRALTNYRRLQETEANGMVLAASIKSVGLQQAPVTFLNDDGANEIAQGFGRIWALGYLRENFPDWWKENYPTDKVPLYSVGKMNREALVALRNDYGRPISKAGAYLLFRDLRDCGNKVKQAIVRMLSPLQQAFGVGAEIDPKLQGQEKLNAYGKRYYGTVSQGYEYVYELKGTVVEKTFVETVDGKRDFRVRAASLAKLHKEYDLDCEADAKIKHPDTGLLPLTQACWVQLGKDAAVDAAKPKGSKAGAVEEGVDNAEVVKFRNSVASTFGKMTMDCYVGKAIPDFKRWEAMQLDFERTTLNPAMEAATKAEAEAQSKTA